MKDQGKEFVRYCNLAVWKTDVLFVISKPDRFIELLKGKMKDSTYEGLCEAVKKFPITTQQGKCYFVEGGGSVIWLKKYIPSVLVHEIFHAVHHMCDNKGMPLTWDSCEAYAYSIDYLFSILSKPSSTLNQSKKRRPRSKSA